MTVRVLRLLEYVYPNHERAEEDMNRWCIPADGTKPFGTVKISSTTMSVRTYTSDEEEQHLRDKVIDKWAEDRTSGQGEAS